uniref:Uncharacterized protein n=2 Tax=Kalmanozyma brasiliensis (strain GHG001) TaxID=1365824 RepID=V5GT40_KALBG
MWNGAELAFRGIGASLGIGSVPKAEQSQADTSAASSKPAQDADISDRSRFADASFDTSGADIDASVVTKVSILEPEVDVEELAAALGIDDTPQDTSIVETLPAPDDSGADLLKSAATGLADEAKPPLTLVTGASTTEPSSSSPISPSNDVRTSDAASIRTSSSAKAFPSISVTSAAWYNTKALRSETGGATSSPKLPSAASIFSDQDKSGDTREPFDMSLGGVSMQSEHHDFELDGWGTERPRPFESFRAYVGESEVPITHESLTLLQEDPFQSTEYRVSFTTRRLLTFVLIERVPATTGSSLAAQGSDTASILDDAWQILRRTQRILNDYHRATAAKQSDETAVRFLHFDGPTLTFQSSLEEEKDKLEPDVQVVADAHCVSAAELMRRHGVVETFSRSSNGKTWTASRLGSKTTQQGKVNQTYMVLAGKKISIVDCDTELRKLANQYPSFGI